MFQNPIKSISEKNVPFPIPTNRKRNEQAMDYAKESLRLHEEWKGKIEVIATVPVATKEDLSLAYTPGVAQPCLEIQKDLSKS